MHAMSPKSREVICSSRIRGAKIRAEGARERAVEAAREADRAEAGSMLDPDGSPWRPRAAVADDNRRVSNGDQVSCVAALAMKRGKSVDFTGYWQRHIAN
jgi:hypothetical protein